MIDETEKTRLLETVDFAITQAKRRNVDVELVLSREDGFSVTARAGDVETLEHFQSKALTISVFLDKKNGAASTSDLSLEAVSTTLDKACSIAEYGGQDPYAGLPDKEMLAYTYPELDLYHAWKITPADAIQMAIECESVAREQDKRITSAEGATVSTHGYFKIFANNLGFIGHYAMSEHSISCSVVAQAQEQMQRDYEYTVARRPEMLDNLTHVAKQAAQKTLQHLGSRKIKTMRCPVIFHSRMAKNILASFVNAISGRNLYREASFLLNHLHKQVFPSNIQIFQQPHLLCAMGSAPFDSEGVRTEDRYYVKDGHLESYVLGSYSGRKLGMQSTGNAGGAYNLIISPSDKNLTQMFKEMGTGLFVTDLMGQGVNLLTGDYSRGASGFWIENGEIQFPVEEITIAGNLKNMLKNIVIVGNDVDLRGNIRTGSILISEMTVAGE